MQANWVKAHQDKKTAVDYLLLDAQLNVCTDADVTSFCLHTPPHLQPSLPPISHQSTKAIIEINNTVITANLQQWIQDNYLCSDILRYIQTQTRLTTTQMDAINWENPAHTNPAD
eukprot:9308489-Ditylum_brightwellii.AAC.1